MKKIISLVAGLIIVSSSMLNAQTASLGPQISYQRAVDADEGKFMGGIVLRVKLMEALGVEGSINYREEQYNSGALTVRSWPVMITGLIYPIPMLYGALGAGWYNAAFDYDQGMPGYQNIADRTTQNFGVHFGGGFELPASSTTKLTVDLRYVYLDYNFEQVPGSSAISSNFYVVSVGFLFDL